MKGEIRHPKRIPKSIIKVFGPIDTESYKDNLEIVKLKSYFITNEFPKYHYIVILEIIESYTEPGYKFCLCHLITHSSGFDNYKITEDLYDNNSSKIDLSKSYITRDKFLIPIDDINEKVYGIFNLQKLKNAIEY
jgi:hypothetical protein